MWTKSSVANLIEGRIPTDCSREGLGKRQDLLGLDIPSLEEIADPRSMEHSQRYNNQIENFVGTVKVPIGLAGPLRVNGQFANGDYTVPLATTEATLVASYNRGAKLISEAGGCRTALLREGVCRAPGFIFETLDDALLFAGWAGGALEKFKIIAAGTTRFGELMDMNTVIEGNHVYLVFHYATGDASGQNMSTIATEAICDHIARTSPIPPHRVYVEANLSGDKKACFQSFQTVRGKKVSAEVKVSADLLASHLHTTPDAITEFWRMSAMGGVLAGTIGVQGHYANGLAALYLACGQDVACVAESAVGVTRFETTDTGDLYAAVTLPNLMVGTVGGGTHLPSQRVCLQTMGLVGAGRARALAELCAALCLAGELSIMAALCEGQFTRAHTVLGRGKK